MSMETSLRVRCVHSWVFAVRACASGWASASESCVFVQNLPEVACVCVLLEVTATPPPPQVSFSLSLFVV